jgi:glutaminyl-tRNA synthetase
MVEDPLDVPEGHDFLEHLNPHSLEEVPALIEPSIAHVTQGYRCQFERTGYFCVDKDSTPNSIIFNKTVGLKDSWAKIQK